MRPVGSFSRRLRPEEEVGVGSTWVVVIAMVAGMGTMLASTLGGLAILERGMPPDVAWHERTADQHMATLCVIWGGMILGAMAGVVVVWALMSRGS
jgi:hypothetical protein